MVQPQGANGEHLPDPASCKTPDRDQDTKVTIHKGQGCDLAMRAALGVYEDLSLTARNDAEARLMLAMQGCPASYHKHPGVHPIFENAESVFSGVAPGTPP